MAVALMNGLPGNGEPATITRHADAGRHPRLALSKAGEAWMPTCVGMTGWSDANGVRTLLMKYQQRHPA